jgi:hypothetical protein
MVLAAPVCGDCLKSRAPPAQTARRAEERTLVAENGYKDTVSRPVAVVLLLAALFLGGGRALAALGGGSEQRVVVRHVTLEVPCDQGRRVPAAWFFPGEGSVPPSGLVWLQHGFFRTGRNVSTLAERIAERTRAIVVAPTISSNPFDAGGCWINGRPMHDAVARLLADRRALEASARAAGWTAGLPSAFVLSGHSAGGNLALATAGLGAGPSGAIDDLRAVILLDGVESGGQMTAALRALSGASHRPVLQIAAPPSSCNAWASGTRALLAGRPGEFVGIELERGVHVDAEGRDTDLLATLVCGVPRPANVRAVHEIAADWIANAFTGSSLGIVGGLPGEEVRVGRATAIVLPA